MTWPLQSICVTNDHRYVQFIVITIRSFPHSWLITRILTRLTWWVPLLEREMFTILEHLTSSQFFVLLNHLCVIWSAMVCPFILFLWLLSVLRLLWLWITLLVPSNFFYDYSEMKKRAFRLLSFMFIYIYILLYIVFNIWKNVNLAAYQIVNLLLFELTVVYLLLITYYVYPVHSLW